MSSFRAENCLLVNRQIKTEELSQYDRIYYGTEFCQNMIPGIKNVAETAEKAADAGKKITFVTPYVTPAGLLKLQEIFGFLDGSAAVDEVVFNDWGVLSLLKVYGGLKPVLGRLLTKQRRDPMADTLIFKKQDIREVSGEGDTRVVSIPQKIPEIMKEHLRSSLINVPVFQDFLLDNGIYRVELDNLLWDMKVEVPEKIEVSLYSPYAYVSTSRLCGLWTLSYGKCGMECRKYHIILGKENHMPLRYYLKGNTIFYKIDTPSLEYLKKKNISRVIHELELP